jgi:hypothetical protein
MPSTTHRDHFSVVTINPPNKICPDYFSKTTVAISSKHYRNLQYQVYLCISAISISKIFVTVRMALLCFYFCFDIFFIPLMQFGKKTLQGLFVAQVRVHIIQVSPLNKFWLSYGPLIQNEFWPVYDFCVSCYTVATTCYKEATIYRR